MRCVQNIIGISYQSRLIVRGPSKLHVIESESLNISLHCWVVVLVVHRSCENFVTLVGRISETFCYYAIISESFLKLSNRRQVTAA